MLSAIAKPFGALMLWLYEWTSNYGVAVILFALIVKLILLPFQMKAKKSTLKQSRLTGRMKEIEKKHGANKQKYNEEVQKLYQEEGVKPMSGCIWSLIPFPILLALYQAIRYPITIMMGVGAELMEEGGAIASKLAELGFESKVNAAYIQIEQSQFITANWSSFSSLSEKLRQMDYSFLGLDLGAKPQLKILWQGDWSNKVDLAIIALIIIPILAAVLTWLQTKISQATMPKSPDGTQDATAQTMNTMNFLMPLMTLYFAFLMPAALGLYWIASSLFALIQEVILNKHYGKILEAEDAERNALREKKEKELEEKRQKTEELRAANATERNAHTSKKKLQLSEREEQRSKAADWRKKQNSENTQEAGRVEDRKYARGRAYDPERYSKLAAEEPEDVEIVEEIIEVEEIVEEIPNSAEECLTEETDSEEDETASDCDMTEEPADDEPEEEEAEEDD